MSQRPSRVYQILVMLIYGEYPWLTRLGAGTIEIKTTPMAKRLRIRNCHCRDSMRWLKEHHFLKSLELYSGSMRLEMNIPKRFFEDFGLDIPENPEKPWIGGTCPWSPKPASEK